MKFYSIYVHIPFCISKCSYCDFNSYCNQENIVEEYIAKLINDIEKFNYFSKNDMCKSIYIGGGTPSFIDEKYIELIVLKIKSKFTLDFNCEITIEVNPSSTSINKIEKYKELGINRISVGLQTTNNDILKIIGRKHNFETFLEKYHLIQQCGFKNINVDLMIGLPNQTLDQVEKDIESVVRLNPTHISCYSLILHEETQLFRDIEAKKYALPSEDDERKMYYLLKNKLKEYGYNQYEISNFCKLDKVSIHNTMCWDQQEYIGFGAGAHSYINCKRFYYENDLLKYINSEHEIIEEDMKEQDKIKEYIILKLRLTDGINVVEMNNRFKIDVLNLFGKEFTKLSEMKLINFSEKKIYLTEKGLDFANIVWEEFI